MKPTISVLMPVYNGEKYLREAVDSILEQTFRDFEFLIINDGSTDHTMSVLGSYSDPRIRIINHKRNLGIVKRLNEGICESKGKYIARMDSDDISLPDRLAQQADFMDENRNIAVCGSFVKVFGNSKRAIWKVPTDHEKIKSLMLFHAAINHPTVLIRTSVLRNHHLYYDPSMKESEDYDLWVRIMNYSKVANLPKALLGRRIHSDHKNNRDRDERISRWANKIRHHLLRELGVNPNKKELAIHDDICGWHFRPDLNFINASEAWLTKLAEQNRISNIYHEPDFSEMLANKWFLICNKATNLGKWVWRKYFLSDLSCVSKVSIREKLFFALRCAGSWK
jgi:glycosyltransferase involved in cell wall biosynthesis